ncbi:MAG TPA: SprT family zinc-dependent metalloprotease [Bacilli bacterium]|nr:SprT family zinc-dependent metalloprotease [Bacilli bacterium]
MYLEFNNNKYEIVIERKNNKNTYIRVKEDLKIYITTNRFVSDKQIQQLIIKNKEVIRKMINKRLKKEEDNKKFMILGKEVNIIAMSSQKEPELYNDKFYIKNISNLDKYLKEYAYNLFKERLDNIYKEFKERIPSPELKIRKMTSRWGVCNKKSNTVTLNLELIKKDIKYADYVIVHELCHFVYFNHSKDFWKLVSKYYPNYKEIRKEMRD